MLRAGCGAQNIAPASRCARNPLRARLHLREAATPRTQKAKPASKRRVCIPAEAGETRSVAVDELPLHRRFSQAPLLATGEVCPKCSRFRAGCAATPEAPLLSFIPVTLDLYRTVRRHLHWTLQNLVAFADRTGRCFPSVRTLAAATGQPRSTVSRHLAQLAAGGRHRAPAAPWRRLCLRDREPLPAGARGVSHQRERGVPPAGTEEQAGKKTGYARARFARSRGELRRDP